ncbi:c-type cytochrome [Bradyrhizobium sp.]|uniref:c-type cytochrome n=1 Tax=Bradyrhizobium sp. TaxID=376 RepID=UPI0027331BB6|nr:c-type cytochrome [Bradyrhizobium sp.]MDP3689790.1 c-type cytochrome [Bradyrhizobium sp.]
MLVVAGSLLSAIQMLHAQDGKGAAGPAEHSNLADFVHRAPPQPTEIWLRAAGGRIYDNWWDALDRRKPEGTHPAYPGAGKRTGANTWRCVECHGWDYNGKDGLYGSGERYTGIKGIRGAVGRDVNRIAALLRAEPHSYKRELINDEEVQRVAIFVSRGQDNADRLIDLKTGTARGDPVRGAGLFQTTCAACHGFDGRALDWGAAKEPAYVGTEANKFPHEVLHKIRNAHPGVVMINLRGFPLQDAIDVLAFARTLPSK